MIKEVDVLKTALQFRNNLCETLLKENNSLKEKQQDIINADAMI